MSGCCWNSAGGTTGDKLWMEHELEILSSIPSAALHEEQNRRETALKRFLNHQKRCRENPAAQHENPPNYNIHIWWTDPNTGKSDWIKRLPLPAGEVREWRTAFLKQKDPAVVSEPDSDWQTPGNKVLIEGRAYFRLYPRLGLCVFSGDHGLPGNYILGQYVGWLYCDGVLAAHNSIPTDSHKLSLRHRATMPSTVTGINGGPVQANGKKFDLRYFWKNGPGSMFNSQSKSKCNCRFVVEYPTQLIYNRSHELFVDDEYTNLRVPEVPYSHRVLPCPFSFLSILVPFSFFLLTLTILMSQTEGQEVLVDFCSHLGLGWGWNHR